MTYDPHDRSGQPDRRPSWPVPDYEHPGVIGLLMMMALGCWPALGFALSRPVPLGFYLLLLTGVLSLTAALGAYKRLRTTSGIAKIIIWLAYLSSLLTCCVSACCAPMVIMVGPVP